MTFARPWWLAGLALLVPLALLHLRRPSLTLREVSSLMLWDRFAGSATTTTRRLKRPRDPLLLLLQALVLCALVLALAGPGRSVPAARPTAVYVVDGSLWMRVDGRLAAARREVLAAAARDTSSRVAVVEATGTPSILYEGRSAGLAPALARLEPDAGSGDLAGAMSLGAGLLGGSEGHMVVLRAPEDPMPATRAARGQLAASVVGFPTDDQGLFAGSARCAVGGSGACEVIATVRNEAAQARVDRYVASASGGRPVTLRVALPARSSTTIVLTAPPASRVRLHLMGRDALALDDTAWISVPDAAGVTAATTVTLVGDPSSALPLARALVAVPGVKLELRRPASYRRSDALASDLVVLDGWLPPSLPPAPAVLLVAPPRVPGGVVTGTLAAPTVSGTASGAELLDGVELESLSIDRNGAERLSLPAWLAPVVWSPDGTLLAAGTNGRQRVAVLGFEPNRSNLAQLAALPILARNLVRWATEWTTAGDDGSLAVDALPATTGAAVAGTSGAARRLPFAGLPAGFTGLAPGLYSVAAKGPRTAHRSAFATSLPEPAAAAAPVDLAAWAALSPPRRHSSLTPWLLVAALVTMAAELLRWRSRRQ